MRVNETTFEQFGERTLWLGRCRENLATEIRVDVSRKATENPDATFAVQVERPDGTAYPAKTKVQNSVLIWTVEAADTAKSGRGWAQIVVHGAEGEIERSKPAETLVLQSINDGGEAPEAEASWLDEANKLLEELKNAGIPEEKISQAVQDYLQKNPPGGVSEEQLNQAVTSALEDAKESGMFDGKDGKTPEKGVDYWTPADREAIVNDVMANFVNAAEVGM